MIKINHTSSEQGVSMTFEGQISLGSLSRKQWHALQNALMSLKVIDDKISDDIVSLMSAVNKKAVKKARSKTSKRVTQSQFSKAGSSGHNDDCEGCDPKPVNQNQFGGKTPKKGAKSQTTSGSAIPSSDDRRDILEAETVDDVMKYFDTGHGVKTNLALKAYVKILQIEESKIKSKKSMDLAEAILEHIQAIG